MAYGVTSYKRTSIQTADRRKLAVMLYEGAIQNLRQAGSYMEAGQYAEQGERINKTLEIIKFLDNALDHSHGEISARLSSLYAYMRDVLIMANVEKRLDKLDEVINLLNTVLEGWRGILEQPQESAPQEQNVIIPENPAPQPRLYVAG